VALPDNRLRFPAVKIDFTNDIGVTGQDHDTVPNPGTARYDHILMWFIGLLSNQSSFSEPTQYRDGTLWFDLNVNILKVYNNGTWSSLSEIISLADGVTLQQWYDQLSVYLETFGPEITFSGAITSNTNSITIPESLRGYVTSNTKCYLYVNGLLKDPRSVQIQNTSILRFTEFTLVNGDEFTAILKQVSSPYFYTTTVSAP
jgi:hypothetical protein